MARFYPGFKVLACIAWLAVFSACATSRSSTTTAAESGVKSVAKADDDFEIAKRYAKTHGLQLYTYQMSRIGNNQGYLAPVLRTRDGGFLLIATRSEKAIVVKLDASGKALWEQSYARKGFVSYEGGSAVELPDGYAIFVLSYVHPARGAVTRLLHIDTAGRPVWDLQLHGNGGTKTPFPSGGVRLVDGTLKMDGHIYLDASEQAYFWHGEASLQGKLLVDSVGVAIRSWKDGVPQP